MAEEVIRQMRNLWEVYEFIEQTYPSPEALRSRSLPGNKSFLVQEGGDEEYRQYRIVDADGNELKWPLKLVSDTRIVS